VHHPEPVARLPSHELFVDNGLKVDMQLESWARSEIGLIRKSNQDSVGVYLELGVFILADGMGGHAAGEVASRMAVDTIHDALRNSGLDNTNAPSFGTRMARLFGRSPAPAPAPADTQAALRAALEHANRTIVQAGANLAGAASGRSMGSTAVVLVIAPNDARAAFAHVGDSRLYRWRLDELALLTADDTLPGDRYRGQPIIPTDLPHTNVLLQALGTQPDVDVTVGMAAIQPGDLFLLCSDGVSGMVDAAFIQDSLRNAPTLEAAGQALIRGALDAGGRDNASLILVRVSGA
jgi:protein phosphatase